MVQYEVKKKGKESGAIRCKKRVRKVVQYIRGKKKGKESGAIRGKKRVRKVVQYEVKKG